MMERDYCIITTQCQGYYPALNRSAPDGGLLLQCSIFNCFFRIQFLYLCRIQLGTGQDPLIVRLIAFGDGVLGIDGDFDGHFTAGYGRDGAAG